MYILFIVLGILLVAYITYLFVEIMRQMARGEEPKNTLFPFLYKPKKEAKQPTIETSKDEKASKVETSEARDSESAKEKEKESEPVKTEEASQAHEEVETEKETDKPEPSSESSTEELLQPELEEKDTKQEAHKLVTSSEAVSKTEAKPAELIDTTSKPRQAKQYNK